MSHIDDTLDFLAGSSWFSTLDVASRVLAGGVEECDKDETAFATPFGHLDCVMPQQRFSG